MRQVLYLSRRIDVRPSDAALTRRLTGGNMAVTHRKSALAIPLTSTQRRRLEDMAFRMGANLEEFATNWLMAAAENIDNEPRRAAARASSRAPLEYWEIRKVLEKARRG